MIGTIHPGTAPADVENLITRPIEKQLKGIDGVKKISSNSIQDYSSIFIEFEISADETQAYLDVKQAVDDARSELPSDLFQEPQISPHRSLRDPDPVHQPVRGYRTGQAQRTGRRAAG